jgi:hypothetical protein
MLEKSFMVNCTKEMRSPRFSLIGKKNLQIFITSIKKMLSKPSYLPQSVIQVCRVLATHVKYIMWSGMEYGEEDIGISDSRRPGKPTIRFTSSCLGAMFSMHNTKQRDLMIELWCRRGRSW